MVPENFLTGLWIKEKIKTKRNIIFFPSIGLLADTLREYLENKNDDFNFLCVCSDSSVSKPGEDELDDRSIYTTTETKEIRKFIIKNRNKNFIIFSTYQSSKKISKASKAFKYDFMICDEAHRTAGKDGIFNLVTKNNKIYAKKRLFMTATPKIASYHTKSIAKSLNKI